MLQKVVRVYSDQLLSSVSAKIKSSIVFRRAKSPINYPFTKVEVKPCSRQTW